jgi:hypothetical protein
MAISYPYDFIDGVERTKVSSIWNSKRPGWPSSGDADDLMFGAGDDADHDGGHAEPRRQELLHMRVIERHHRIRP